MIVTILKTRLVSRIRMPILFPQALPEQYVLTVNTREFIMLHGYELRIATAFDENGPRQEEVWPHVPGGRNISDTFSDLLF